MGKETMLGELPANAYQEGDMVFGEDEGGTYIGRVVETRPMDVKNGDITVCWNGEDYEPGSVGNLVPVALLRLWPERAHEHRKTEILRQPEGGVS